MKWQAILMVFWASVGVAQQNLPPSQPVGGSGAVTVLGFGYETSYKDVYCAGFITRERFAAGRAVQGGSQLPEADHYETKDTVFLTGSGYEVGARYAVIRDIRDPNHYQYYPGQSQQLHRLGHAYAELGLVRIDRIEKGLAIARIEAGCQPILAGDLVVPFHEREGLVAKPRTMPYQVFGVALPPRHGTIVMGNEYDVIFGLHKIVYISLGSKAGLKPGDYLRISRTYDPSKMPEVNRLSLDGPVYDDTQRRPLTVSSKMMKKWPTRGVGEMMVLSATPESATCLITIALEDLQVGDLVSPEDER